MPIQKKGKTYYTMEELSQRLDESIERNAQELLEDLRRARKISEKQEVYV
jgi:hypothetical protein